MSECIDRYVKEYLEKHSRLIQSGTFDDRISSPLPEKARSIPEKNHLSERSIAMNIHMAYFNHSAPHRHDFFEMFYVYRGCCQNLLFRDDLHTPVCRLTFSQGDLCLLNPNVVHLVNIPCDHDHVVFNIMFRRELFQSALFSLFSDNRLISQFFLNYFYLKKDQDDYLISHNEPGSKTDRLACQMLEEFINDDICSDGVLKSYLVILLSEMVRGSECTIDSRDYDRFSKINLADILEYLNTHAASATLKSTAEHFHYSPGYLSAFIKKNTQKTFSELLLEQKLAHTCEYLKQSELPVGEIMEISGFTDRTYFYRVFRDRFGVTPAAFREQKHGFTQD